MGFGGFWKNVGKGLAKVGGASLQGAKWASAHPEVFEAVAAATGHPEDAAIIAKVAPLVNVVTSEVKK